MKSRAHLLIVVGLVFILGVQPVWADGSYPPGVTFNSPFVIQNMSTTDTASVQVEFYDIPTGSLISAATQSLSILPGRAQPVRPWNISALPDNGKYSVVISSSQQVAAIANHQDVPGGNSRAMSVIGLGSGGQNLYCPNITKEYFGWNTAFYIQNTGDSSTNVTIKFYKFSDGTEVSAAQKVIALLDPGRSYEYDPLNEATLPGGGQYSVVATADAGGTIVGTVLEFLTAGSVQMGYNCFNSGGSSVYLPNITKSYYGWDTPFIVQNIGASETTLTIKYYDFTTGDLVYTVTPAPTIGPRLSYAGRPWQISDSSLPSNKQYSVVVESSASNIVAVVNEQNPISGSTQAMSYDGFNSGGSSVYLPNLTKSYYSWDTPFIIQNVGATDASVVVKFYDFTTGTEYTGAQQNISTLGSGRSVPIRPWQIAGLDSNKQYSAVVEASGSTVVVVVNEQYLSTTAIDQAMAYEGIPK